MEQIKRKQVGVNLLTSFCINLRQLQNGCFIDLPFFYKTKKVAFTIKFAYASNTKKLKKIHNKIYSEFWEKNFWEEDSVINLNISKDCLRKIYRKKELSLDKENSILTGEFEIHFFKPKYPVPENPDIVEIYFAQQEVLPLLASEISDAAKILTKQFYKYFE
ncbi:hypothetical protein IPN41_01285 [Candidatus Falkowbacteria bacterium]|nr:MAG: hypothetical protein IPN41_01285 [Candidatus Falkowbacteria bacterium]